MQTRSSRSTSKRKQKNINKGKDDILQTNYSPVKELVWVVWLTLFILVFLSLISWSSDDVGWFQVTSQSEPSNLLGRAGASISDFLIFCFGLSSYWWAVLFASLSISSFRKSSMLRENAKVGRSNNRNNRLDDEVEDEDTSFYVDSSFSKFCGFILLLAGSTVIEAQRISFDNLVLSSGAGGALGSLLGGIGEYVLGPLGLTVISSLFVCTGLSLFFSFSWFVVFEILGRIFEISVLRIKNLFHSIEDSRLGASAIKNRLLKRKELKDSDPSFFSSEKKIKVISSNKEENYGVHQQKLFDITGALDFVPPLTLLSEKKTKTSKVSESSLSYISRLIEKRLGEFGVEVKVVSAQPGPVVTRYEIEPAIGVKGSQVVALAKDLARSLSLLSIRVVETIPGKNLMGLELPNSSRELVGLSEILYSPQFLDNNLSLPLALGKDIAGNSVVVDLARMPHLLVAGTTGAGKSVGINAFLLSLIFHSPPSEVRFILIDPKMLEFSAYEDIPHLLTPVVTDVTDAGKALKWSVSEMERRYKLLSHFGVRSLTSFNKKINDAKANGKPIENPFYIDSDLENDESNAEQDEKDKFLEPLPKIVVVIDELADLMMVVGKKVESLIARLAQKARAAGIHLILATQRPSVDVITGLIKANIPARISYQVSSRVDSRTILDQMGAESLLGQGDMLFLMPGSGLPKRVHGAFVTDEEVISVVDYLKKVSGANYEDDVMRTSSIDELSKLETKEFGNDLTKQEKDPLYEQAVSIILKNRRASISLVQRHLRIGYNRAARLLDTMEAEGVVSEMQSNGNREILLKDIRS